MKLRVTLDVPDEMLARDTGDKLFGRKGLIEHRLCQLLAEQLYKSCTVTYEETSRSHYDGSRRVVATVIVGKEVHYEVAPLPQHKNPWDIL